MTKKVRTIILIIVFVGVLFAYRTVIAEHNLSCDDAYEIKIYARCMVSEKWNDSEWSAFDYIIERESGWDYKADNPKSSAYGLPQAMMSLHDLPDDYKTNPHSQIDWAINYIEDRYGSPQEAKYYWDKNKHY